MSTSTDATTKDGRRLWIAAAVIVVGLIVINLVAQALDRAVGGNQPGGANGSSYATAADGLAAFGSLLAHYDYRVEQRPGPITGTSIPDDATVFVLEPNVLTADDAATLLQFVTNGGRLIIGGDAPFYLRDLSDEPPAWQPQGATAWTNTDTTLGHVSDIEGLGLGSWKDPGRGSTVVGDSSFSLLTQDQVGRGEILYLADASPLENAFLATGDNAAFALALAGDASRPVLFPEGIHGYGRNRGLSAIPDRWKIALLLIAVAALAFVWSRARRFGPPDREARELPPARAEYVRALSVSLERTHDQAGSLASAQAWTRTRLATRAGLGANAPDGKFADEDFVRAARSFGCSGEEITAMLTPVTDEASILALGRAVVRVGGGDGRLS